LFYNISMKNEIWKPVVGYEGLYEVSNLGRVKSLPRNGTIRQERVLRENVKRSGYVNIVLRKNGKPRTFRLHRLVARAFIQNPENKPQVNHKNGDKRDNRAINLEWTTVSENLKHKFSVLGWQADRHGTKKVRCVENGNIYDGRRLAERENKLAYGCIKQAIQRNGTAGGLHWEYVD